MKISNDSICRLYKNTDETTEHILFECEFIAGTEYIKTHNEMAKIM